MDTAKLCLLVDLLSPSKCCSAARLLRDDALAFNLTVYIMFDAPFFSFLLLLKCNRSRVRQERRQSYISKTKIEWELHL